MPARPAAAELLGCLAGVMDTRGTRWYVLGAQAVAVHGQPRMTADVDVAARIPDDDLGAFIETAQRAGFALRVEDVDDFVRRTRVLPLVHTPTGVPLDIILIGSPIEEQFLDRAQPMDLGGVAAPVISAEDLLVTKILAGRPKDLEDVRGILRVQGDRLDVRRVRDLLGDIERALARSDLQPLLDRAIEETSTS